jgi:nitrogen-specific signal transduction histidine kinase
VVLTLDLKQIQNHEMRTENKLITQSVITEKLAASLITSTFTDAMLLDQDFNIVSISKELACLFGCHDSRLEGASIRMLSDQSDIQSRLHELIQPGFFKEELFDLKLGTGKSIPVGITGFRLGLISDLIQFIVLRLRNLDEIQSLTRSLSHKAEQVEDFIYRSSHELCGPVATIKGLVNLSKLPADDIDVNMLFDHISRHADVLNKRLRELERWTSLYDDKS